MKKNKNKKGRTTGINLSLPYTFKGYVVINLLLASGEDKWSELPVDMQRAHDHFWDDHIDMMLSDYWYEVLEETKKEFDYLLPNCQIDFKEIPLPLSNDNYYRLVALMELEFFEMKDLPEKLRKEYEKASDDWMAWKYPADSDY